MNGTYMVKLWSTKRGYNSTNKRYLYGKTEFHSQFFTKLVMLYWITKAFQTRTQLSSQGTSAPPTEAVHTTVPRAKNRGSLGFDIWLKHDWVHRSPRLGRWFRQHWGGGVRIRLSFQVVVDTEFGVFLAVPEQRRTVCSVDVMLYSNFINAI